MALTAANVAVIVLERRLGLQEQLAACRDVRLPVLGRIEREVWEHQAGTRSQRTALLGRNAAQTTRQRRENRGAGASERGSAEKHAHLALGLAHDVLDGSPELVVVQPQQQSGGTHMRTPAVSFVQLHAQFVLVSKQRVREALHPTVGQVVVNQVVQAVVAGSLGYPVAFLQGLAIVLLTRVRQQLGAKQGAFRATMVVGQPPERVVCGHVPAQGRAGSARVAVGAILIDEGDRRLVGAETSSAEMDEGLDDLRAGSAEAQNQVSQGLFLASGIADR